MAMTTLPGGGGKLERRVALLEQYCDHLGKQVANVQIAMRQLPHAALTGGSEGEAGAGSASGGAAGAVATNGALTNGGATSSVVAVTTQLTPKATAALASEVRRSVLSHVDVRFAALENVKDAGFEDVWNELRRLTESIQGVSHSAELHIKEVDVSLRGELLGTTESMEAQLDAIHSGVGGAMQKQQDDTAAAIANTLTQVSTIEETLTAEVKRLDGAAQTAAEEREALSSSVAALQAQTRSIGEALNVHSHETQSAFQRVHDSMSALSEEVAALKTASTAAASRVNDLESTLAGATKRLADLAEAVAEQRNSSDVAHAELRRRCLTLERGLEQGLAAAEARTSEAAQRLEATASRHEADIEQGRQATAQQGTQLAAAVQNVSAQRLELQRIGDELNHVAETLAGSRGETSAHADAIESLRSQVGALAAQSNDLARIPATLTAVSKQVAANTQGVDETRNALSSHARGLQSIRHDIAELSERIASQRGSKSGSGVSEAHATALVKELEAARKAISNHSTDVDSRIADAGQRQRSSLLKEVQRAVQTWSDAHAAAVNKELRTLHKRLDAVAATSGVVPVRASSRGRSRTDGDARSSGSGNVPPTVAPATAAAAAAAASAARALAAAASESVNDDGSSHRSVSGAGAGAGVGASEGARSEGRRSGREASTGAGGGAGGGAGVSSVPPANAEGGAGGGGGGGDSGAAPEEPPFVGAMVGVRAGSVTSGAPSTVMGGDRTTIGDARVYKSPMPALPQVRKSSLTSYLLRRAMNYKDKIAFMAPAMTPEYGGTRRSDEKEGTEWAGLGTLTQWLSYRDFQSQVRLVAAGLARGGFNKFDVLAIYAPNHVQYAVCFHAVIALGGVVAPCPASEPKEAIARHMATTRPRVIVTTSAMLSVIHSAMGLSGVGSQVVLMDGDETDESGPPTLSHLMSGGTTGFPTNLRVTPRKDPAMLLYVPSAGEGKPMRVIMLTHHNIVTALRACEAAAKDASVRQVASLLGDSNLTGDRSIFHAADKLVCGASFASAAGVLWGLHLPLLAGVTIVCTPFSDRDAGVATSSIRLSEAVERCKASVLVLSRPLPTLVQTLPSAVRQVIQVTDLDVALDYVASPQPLPPPGVALCCVAGPQEQLCASFVLPLTSTSSPPRGTAAAAEMARNRKGGGSKERSTLLGTVGVLLAAMKCRLVEPSTGKGLPGGAVPGVVTLGGSALACGLLSEKVTPLGVDAYRFFHCPNIVLIPTDSGLFLVPPDRLRPAKPVAVYHNARGRPVSAPISHIAVGGVGIGVGVGGGGGGGGMFRTKSARSSSAGDDLFAAARPIAGGGDGGDTGGGDGQASGGAGVGGGGGGGVAAGGGGGGAGGGGGGGGAGVDAVNPDIPGQSRLS